MHRSISLMQAQGQDYMSEIRVLGFPGEKLLV